MDRPVGWPRNNVICMRLLLIERPLEEEDEEVGRDSISYSSSGRTSHLNGIFSVYMVCHVCLAEAAEENPPWKSPATVVQSKQIRIYIASTPISSLLSNNWTWCQQISANDVLLCITERARDQNAREEELSRWTLPEDGRQGLRGPDGTAP